MSTTPEQLAAKPVTPTARMIMVLSGIAMLSGFLVVLTSQLTAPRIAENQRLAIERAVVQIIPGAVSFREFVLDEKGLQPLDSGGSGEVIYAGYDVDNKLAGIAARAGAQGYADMIYLLYGYAPDCQCIRGIKVLKMAETPGLGDKIIKDAAFVSNFDALDARLDGTGTALENPIVTVKHGNKQHAWEIDAVSGATISSKAVGKALNQSAQQLLPRVLPLIDQLKTAGKE